MRKSVVSWWSPTLPKTPRPDMNSSEGDFAKTQQPSHSTKLYPPMKTAYVQPGGLGAHGSNPCTPTTKKARNNGLSSFQEPVEFGPFGPLDQVLDQVLITGTHPNSTEHRKTQAERVQLSTWANHSS